MLTHTKNPCNFLEYTQIFALYPHISLTVLHLSTHLRIQKEEYQTKNLCKQYVCKQYINAKDMFDKSRHTVSWLQFVKKEKNICSVVEEVFIYFAEVKVSIQQCRNILLQVKVKVCTSCNPENPSHCVCIQIFQFNSAGRLKASGGADKV